MTWGLWDAYTLGEFIDTLGEIAVEANVSVGEC